MKGFLYGIILFGFLLYLFVSPIKVCENFVDYLTIDFNSKCFINPDVDASPEQVAKNHGYFLDRIELISIDGYILDLFHLVRNPGDILNNRPPVLIQHSILTNVKTFMANGKKSLAFAFLDKNYDVWLSSFRTILRKEGHINMSSSNPDYWKFSYYDMAINDIPIFIDHVRSHNLSPQKLVFLGHAQGSILGYVYASMKPDEAEQNLGAIFSLASVVFGNYSKSPFIRLGFMNLLGFLGTNSLTRGFYNQVLMPYGDVLCQTFCYTLRNVVGCKIIMDLIFNGAYSEFDAEYFPSFVYTLKTIPPYIAKDIDLIYKTGKFEGRDYKSSEENPKVIEYNLENIRVPVYIFEGSNDVVSDLRDARKTFEKLINTKRKLFVVDEDFPVKFVHTDTFVGKGIGVFCEKMFEELKSIQKN